MLLIVFSILFNQSIRGHVQNTKINTYLQNIRSDDQTEFMNQLMKSNLLSTSK